MAAHRLVYDSRHLQADCQEPGSAPERYARQSSMGYLCLFTITAVMQEVAKDVGKWPTWCWCWISRQALLPATMKTGM